jgi:hypothetical protein
MLSDPVGVLQFIVDELQSDLLELDISEGAFFHGILPFMCFSRQVKSFLRDTAILYEISKRFENFDIC